MPALWVGLSPEAVLRSLVEAVHQMLRGEWVYAVLKEDAADHASAAMQMKTENRNVAPTPMTFRPTKSA